MCRFERQVTDVAGSLQRARQETLARGGTFEGDATQGHFVLKTPMGSIEGSYAAKGVTVTFVVDHKPSLVPCKLIGGVLDQFLT